MVIGSDQTGRKEGANSHADGIHDVAGPEKPAKSIFARMKERTMLALAIASMATTLASSCVFKADGLDPVQIPDQDASVQDGAQDAGSDKDGSVDQKDAGDSGTDLDSGKDSGPDLDSGNDGGDMNDSGLDSGFDAGEDSGPDAGLDAGQDAGLDAGEDSGPDAGLDAGEEDSGTPDAGPAVCPSATTGTYFGFVGQVTPTFVGGYGFLYKGYSGSTAFIDITCEANSAPIVSDLACLTSTTKNFDIPQDGKRIAITPTILGATNMKGNFDVSNH